MDIGSGIPLPYASLRPGLQIDFNSDGSVHISEPGTVDVHWPAGSGEAKDYQAALGSGFWGEPKSAHPVTEAIADLTYRVAQIDRVTRTVTYGPA